MKSFPKTMMIVFVIILSVFMLIGIVLFFVLKNFDLNKFKPQIINQIEQALGRPTRIGDLKMGISLSQGLSLSVSNVQISDDLAFSQQPFISIEKLGLGLDLLGLITRRQVNISTVEISRPYISLIRNEEGVFNFQSLLVLQKKDQASSPSSASSVSSAVPSAGVAALLVQNIFINNGVFNFEDHFEEDKAISLNKIDLKVSEFSLLHPFKILFKAACLSDKQNIAGSGMAVVDVLKANGILKNIQVDIDFSLMDVKLLTGIFPTITQAKLQNPLGGSFKCSVDQIQASAQGIDIKKLQGSLTGGEIRTSYLKVPVKNIEAKIEIIGEKVAIDPASCALGQGRIDFNGTINHYLSTQEYKFTISMDNVSIGQVVNQGGQNITLEGLASAQSVIQGQGFESLAAFNPDSGQVMFHLKDGQIRNINILKVVLDKMSMLPDLTEKLQQNLPEKYRTKLEQSNTEISAVDFDISIQSGQTTIRSAKAQADVFSLEGQGTMNSGLSMNLVTRIIIPEDLSKSMMSTAQELKFITDRSGQIVIPITITGKIPNTLMYLPDLEYLGRQLFETKGREELGNLLNKVLKGKGGSSDAGSDSDSGTSDGISNPGQEIINNVFDAIFKK